jgi:hypothetical protein
MTMSRPSFSVTPQAPGSEPTAEATAALAVGYLVFKDEGTGGARMLLPGSLAVSLGTSVLGVGICLPYVPKLRGWASLRLTHDRDVCGLSDSVYAEELLAHARQQYDLAQEHQAQFQFSNPFYQ